MIAATLPYQLERSIVIDARRETVFRFFTDAGRWAAWWGAGSTIDARPGGALLIRFPGSIEVVGEVLSLTPPEEIVFTYGFVSGKPIPPGASRVTIRLSTVEASTHLALTHEFSDETARDEHVQGWRYHVSVFANTVANEIHRDARQRVDAWFGALAETDHARREQLLAGIATPDISFRDRNSVIGGIAELVAQTGAYHRFMPGIRFERRGEVRQCLGTALADWAAVASDGQERLRGTSVFVFDADGQLQSVTGFTG